MVSFCEGVRGIVARADEHPLKERCDAVGRVAQDAEVGAVDPHVLSSHRDGRVRVQKRD